MPWNLVVPNPELGRIDDTSLPRISSVGKLPTINDSRG
jgi:hypothetical protein